MDFGGQDNKKIIIIVLIAIAAYWWYTKNSQNQNMFEFFESAKKNQGHEHRHVVPEEMRMASLPTAMEVPHYASVPWQQ